MTPVNGEVDFGDIQQWPAAPFALTSDVPVRINIYYPEEGQGSGNTLFKTNHSLANVIPLEYNARAQLTDASSTVYYSPYAKFALSQGCNAVSLDFKGGSFEWSGTMSALRRELERNLASISASLTQLLQELEALLQR